MSSFPEELAQYIGYNANKKQPHIETDDFFKNANQPISNWQHLQNGDRFINGKWVNFKKDKKDKK